MSERGKVKLSRLNLGIVRQLSSLPTTQAVNNEDTAILLEPCWNLGRSGRILTNQPKERRLFRIKVLRANCHGDTAFLLDGIVLGRRNTDFDVPEIHLLGWIDGLVDLGGPDVGDVLADDIVHDTGRHEAIE